jgi:hypothetical protein
MKIIISILYLITCVDGDRGSALIVGSTFVSVGLVIEIGNIFLIRRWILLILFLQRKRKWNKLCHFQCQTTFFYGYSFWEWNRPVGMRLYSNGSRACIIQDSLLESVFFLFFLLEKKTCPKALIHYTSVLNWQANVTLFLLFWSGK